MHKRPQLHEIVLKWSASQQQPPLRIKVQQSLPALGFKVLLYIINPIRCVVSLTKDILGDLDIVSLIEDHVVPSLLTKRLRVLHDQLIRGNADMEGV